MKVQDYQRIAVSALGALLLSATMVSAAVGPAHGTGTGQAVGTGAAIEARTAAGEASA